MWFYEVEDIFLLIANSIRPCELVKSVYSMRGNKEDPHILNVGNPWYIFVASPRQLYFLEISTSHPTAFFCCCIIDTWWRVNASDDAGAQLPLGPPGRWGGGDGNEKEWEVWERSSPLCFTVERVAESEHFISANVFLLPNKHLFHVQGYMCTTEKKVFPAFSMLQIVQCSIRAQCTVYPVQ